MPAHPELVSAFTAALIDGALPPSVTAQVPDEAARRFAVYRNNVSAGLAAALSRRFPVIERLVGPEFFRAMGQIYLEAHRPKSPVLLEWGDTFPGFLADFPPLAAYPYMADVARIEVARGWAYHAGDASPIAPDRLIAAASDPGTARLGLHPSVQVLPSSHPAVSIWAANQPGTKTNVVSADGPEIALILRDARFEVPVAVLGAGDAELISALQDGQTLMAAAERAALTEADHDPQTILVRLMQAGVITLPQDIP
ncbi:DNA-binding domain-containing protein [Tabrizicola sp. BL-A-41-H6]|uniref:HvfC/BufC N-terminal domain-containing protein n=1 Tax=Tabrizicola sp. BL-A-41-H6 TaxID=3421107 RepID=UPI003D676435